MYTHTHTCTHTHTTYPNFHWFLPVLLLTSFTQFSNLWIYHHIDCLLSFCLILFPKMLSRSTKSDGCTQIAAKLSTRGRQKLISQAQTHHQEPVIQKVPCKGYVSFLSSKLFSVGRQGAEKKRSPREADRSWKWRHSCSAAMCFPNMKTAYKQNNYLKCSCLEFSFPNLWHLYLLMWIYKCKFSHSEPKLMFGK